MAGDEMRVTSSQTAQQQQFTQQRSILKNSVDRTQEDQEMLEAKKQLILRRRRLFSHYRQYEQWRRRQFSYDPCYMRSPAAIAPVSSSTYASMSNGVGVGVGSRAPAGRRRRQYQRQYSCAEECANLRDSQDCTSLHKCHSLAGSDMHKPDTNTLYQIQSANSQSESVSVSCPSKCFSGVYPTSRFCVTWLLGEQMLHVLHSLDHVAFSLLASIVVTSP